MKNLVMNFLRQEGFQPQETPFGIAFKADGLSYAVLIDEDDSQFLRIALPNIFDVTAENRVAVLEAINTVNMDMKVSKTCIWGDSVTVFVEQLIDESPELGDIIPRTLRIMNGTRRSFYQAIEE